jgi:hypothetical protein
MANIKVQDNIFHSDYGDAEWLVLYEMAQTRHNILMSPEEIMTEITDVCVHHYGPCVNGFKKDEDDKCCIPDNAFCFKPEASDGRTEIPGQTDGSFDAECEGGKINEMIIPIMGSMFREWGMSKIFDSTIDAYVRKKEQAMVSKLLKKNYVKESFNYRTGQAVDRLIEKNAHDVWTSVKNLQDPLGKFNEKISKIVKRDITDTVKKDYWKMKNYNDADKKILENMIREKSDNMLQQTNLEKTLTNSKAFNNARNGVPKFTKKLTFHAKSVLRKGTQLQIRNVVPNVLNKALGKLATRISTKTSAQLAKMGAKLMAYVAAGPIGVAMMIFEVISLALDVWDPLAFNSFTSIDVIGQQRDKIEIGTRTTSKNDGNIQMTIQPDGEILDTNGPMIFPIATVFKLQFGLAQRIYGVKVIELIQEDPILKEEYEIIFDSAIDLIDASQNFLDPEFIEDVSGCDAENLPEYGRPATPEEQQELNIKYANVVLRNGLPILSNEEAAKWERRPTGQWVESALYAENNFRGCADPDVQPGPCPCARPMLDENGEIMQTESGEASIEGYLLENSDMIENLLTDKIVSLSYKLSPRKRAKLFYECLIEQLKEHDGIDAEGKDFKFPECRHHVRFCPELLPDDGPENSTFFDHYRASCLSKFGQKEHYQILVYGDENGTKLSEKFKTDTPWFPLWSKYYRVRDPTDPGTTVYPKSATKLIPKMVVREYIRTTDAGNIRLLDPQAVITAVSGASLMLAVYKTDTFAQTSALGPIMDACLSQLDPSTGDIVSAIHKGGHHCKAYKNNAEFTETVEQQKIPDGDANNCAQKAVALNAADGTTEYTTQWEARGDYEKYLNTRLKIDPTKFGVTFDDDTGLCNYTKEYCDRFGLGRYLNKDLGMHDCEPISGTELLEMIFGTTVTRAGIIAAMQVDRQYVWINDRLATVCHSGARALVNKNTSFGEVYKLSTCGVHFAMTGFRAFVQTGIAVSGLITSPLAAGLTEFTDLLVGAGSCGFNKSKQLFENAFDSGTSSTDTGNTSLELMECFDGGSIVFSTAAAAIWGFKDAKDHLTQSFADAVGDMAAVFGLSDGNVQNAVEEGINAAMRYTGIDFAIDASAQTAAWLADNSRLAPSYSDKTLIVPVFLVASLRFGKNTNICVGDKCADDLVAAIGVLGKTLVKGFKKVF